MTTPEQPRTGAWFSADDVEVARQRLADNRYGGPHDTSECLDDQDITEIIKIVLTATRQSAVAQGRCQTTEGWEREWGVRYPDGYLLDWRANESGARTHARGMGVDGAVVSRLVGPWEPVEQDEAPVREGDALGVTDDHRNDLAKSMSDFRDRWTGGNR